MSSTVLFFKLTAFSLRFLFFDVSSSFNQKVVMNVKSHLHTTVLSGHRFKISATSAVFRIIFVWRKKIYAISQQTTGNQWQDCTLIGMTSYACQDARKLLSNVFSKGKNFVDKFQQACLNHFSRCYQNFYEVKRLEIFSSFCCRFAVPFLHTVIAQMLYIFI